MAEPVIGILSVGLYKSEFLPAYLYLSAVFDGEIGRVGGGKEFKRREVIVYGIMLLKYGIWDHTLVCLEVEMAWKSGDKALKSLFSAKLCLLSLKDPCPLLSTKIFAGHSGVGLDTKSFL